MSECAEYIDRVIAEFASGKAGGRVLNAAEMAEEWKAQREEQEENPKEGVPRVPHDATFSDLCEIEPCLRELEARIREAGPFGHVDQADAAWQWKYKQAMIRLVGFYARKPELRTSHAYDTAYDHLHNLIEKGLTRGYQRPRGDRKW